MQIPFGEWLPDQPEYLNPGATTANNVYYAQNSYKRDLSGLNKTSLFKKASNPVWKS